MLKEGTLMRKKQVRVRRTKEQIVKDYHDWYKEFLRLLNK
jgi:hypothetical protein